MRKALKRLDRMLTAGGLLAAWFVWGHAPQRAKRLAEKYERFRADLQFAHDALDAQFQHHECVVDGLRWHYVEEGDPGGTPVLLLHGLPECWYSWRYVLPKLDHAYRLIAIDMKGYGRSDLQDPDYNWHTVAAQTLALMEHLGARQFFVVGHDWGALIGSVLVGDHPERIYGFVRMQADLIPKAGDERWKTYLQKPQFVLFRSNWLATYMMRDAAAFIDMVYRTRMNTPLARQDRDYLVYEWSRPGVAEMNPRYFQARNWDLDAALGKICRNQFPFPVLQLQADGDPSQPRELFADVASECPNVRLEWITGANHFDNLDQPEQVADAINRFVRATAPPAASPSTKPSRRKRRE